MKIADAIRFPLRVVAIGGGTGLPVVLRGMKSLLFPDGADDPSRLVGVVTVTDEGGSSGRLRDELGVLPPGDVRNCLVALSHNEPLMSRLFQTRYRGDGSLAGHSVGNLILAGLAQDADNGFLGAIELASDVLNIQGRVLPSTHVATRLVARLRDGRHVIGETALVEAGGVVESLRLDPAAPPAAPGVTEAIERADIVVLGPGSLFTSIVPNLLIPDVADALARSRAFRVLVVNAMTEAGETTTFTASDHVRAVREHAGPVLDAAILASDAIPIRVQIRYQAEGADRVASDHEEIERFGLSVYRKRLLRTSPKVRHDPLLTAGAVLTSFAAWRDAGRPRAATASRRRAGGDDARSPAREGRP